jgi:hypothetical protein
MTGVAGIRKPLQKRAVEMAVSFAEPEGRA